MTSVTPSNTPVKEEKVIYFPSIDALSIIKQDKNYSPNKTWLLYQAITKWPMFNAMVHNVPDRLLPSDYKTMILGYQDLFVNDKLPVESVLQLFEHSYSNLSKYLEGMDFLTKQLEQIWLKDFHKQYLKFVQGKS